MQPKRSKAKKTYFNSPKKEPLVKKMIFDPHEAILPASCFDLRPINENESNQQQIIFDPKSSSMKEISDFEKNSPHEFDKIIYGINQNHHNDNIFLNTQRSHLSSIEPEKDHYPHQNYSENSNSFKRDSSLSPQDTKKYENVAKIFQTFEQNHQAKEKYYRIFYENAFQHSKIPTRNKNEISSKQRTKKNFKSKQKNQDLVKIQQQEIKGLQNPINWQDGQFNKTPKIQKVWPQQEQLTHKQSKKRGVKKFTENAEFQLINQYTELISYASLIEDMITVYDRSPLFECPLDFDSEPEQTNHEQDNDSSKKRPNLKQNFNQSSSQQVKVQEISMELENIKFDSQASQSQKIEKECFTLLDKMRLNQAPQKNKKMVMKQINFQKTKTYLNFYEPIQELKPYIKKMTLEEKKLFLAFKKELKQIKDIIDYFDKKKNNQRKQHVCKICGQQFESGRQLGGHMSRKHPGKALEYIFKKELRKVKQIERDRRKYFKNSKKDVKDQEEDIV